MDFVSRSMDVLSKKLRLQRQLRCPEEAHCGTGGSLHAFQHTGDASGEQRWEMNGVTMSALLSKRLQSG